MHRKCSAFMEKSLSQPQTHHKPKLQGSGAMWTQAVRLEWFAGGRSDAFTRGVVVTAEKWRSGIPECPTGE
jgi:hypothetical protein